MDNRQGGGIGKGKSGENWIGIKAFGTERGGTGAHFSDSSRIFSEVFNSIAILVDSFPCFWMMCSG
jgi:hypothetical protein